MTLEISLSPEAEARLRERAAESGKDPATYARAALEEQLASRGGSTPEQSPLPVDQRIAELLSWAAKHRPLGRVVDDSRESIYEGCGE